MIMAAQIAARLEEVEVAEGMRLLEESAERALYFDVVDDAMCIMHLDGSVNIIDRMNTVDMTVQAISAAHILRVLKHYRPFTEVLAKWEP